MAKKESKKKVVVSLGMVDRAMLIIMIMHRTSPPPGHDVKVTFETTYWLGQAIDIVRKYELEGKTISDLITLDRDEDYKPEEFKFPMGCYLYIVKAFKEIDWWRLENTDDLYKLMEKFNVIPDNDHDNEEIELPTIEE